MRKCFLKHVNSEPVQALHSASPTARVEWMLCFDASWSGFTLGNMDGELNRQKAGSSIHIPQHDAL